MADSAVIKEFLISLGFAVKGKSDWDQWIVGTTSAIVKLSAMATAAVGSIALIADQMERLYFVSQRTNASAANIQALGFAIGQMGGSSEAAVSSLENLARFMRNSPGASGLIQSIGVSTKDANGGLRDTTAILEDLGKKFAAMPYYRANAYAQALGIDEKTLMALRENVGEFGDQYQARLKAIGLDSNEAAKNSHAFMNEVRATASIFTILGQKVGTDLAARMIGSLRSFQDAILKNSKPILKAVDSLVTGVLYLSDVVSTLAIRGFQAISTVVEWFGTLDAKSKTVIEAFAAILVAWRVLNAGFLTSPIGVILTLGAGILLLYDDFKTWKEGGKHLIPWEAWEPQINKAIFGIRRLGVVLKAIGQVAYNLFTGKFAQIREDYLASQKEYADLSDQQDREEASNPTNEDGISQKYIDSLKDRGGARLTPDAAQRLPRGIRNNNPGNLNYAGQAGASKEGGPNGRFAVFGSAQAGLEALAIQLVLYGKRGIDTISAIISKYAPAGENNTSKYISDVSKALGVGAGDKLNLKDPAALDALMGAIIRVENGNNPYQASQIHAASTAVASRAGGVSAPISQTNNFTVSGSDPKATASAVLDGLSGANANLIRNMKGAVS